MPAMINMVNQILSYIGLDPHSKAQWTIIVIVLTFGWWIYSRALSDIAKSDALALAAFQDLHFPALGLLLAKQAGRIETDAFQEQFTALLVAHRAKAWNPGLRRALDRWLGGSDNEKELRDLLEHVCQKEWSKHHDLQLFNHVGRTIGWFVERFSVVLFISFALILLGEFSIKTISMNPQQKIAVSVSTLLLFAPLVLYGRLRRKRSAESGTIRLLRDKQK